MHMIRTGKKPDIEKVKIFLTEAKISTEGVESIINYFVLIEDIEGNLLATLGVEPAGKVGILRSMVVKPVMKEEDLLIIFQHVYKLAIAKNLSTLYLTTVNETSIRLFHMMGFQKVERESLPKEFANSLYGKQLLTYEQAIYMEKVM
ncbi:GNAT family N-acetyltransferase [Heyndrickxia sp. NPDC080065]|uniref:GNAT family N-acetyltransferase n=1 Tax=Heyndrickxia sp. NPDC080065 TaxID=3390568 RepID=UPI003CFCF1F1